ncbi:MAG: hypothetical protein A2Y95_00315 [Deltaproteobacteria bacterium RBG_13_65_10]|nr:MAG: hypothetical protein A2Y95_00315 [Deltaproteobacteria bacterium RBG_13_65_10]
MNNTDARGEAFLARVTAFARERVAPTAAQRDREGMFPRDLWRGLGETGLFGAMLPPQEGGLGLPLQAMAAALYTLAREGHDASLGVSILPSLVLANFHLPRLGTRAQKARILPRIVSGEWVAALGFSEFPHGANPKYIETSARRDGDAWVIDGRKAFVTNGLDADLFVILAVTSRDGDRKGFTAFFVEKETSGLTVEERMPLAFIRAAPHAIVRLGGCVVGNDQCLGELGTALAEISASTRTAEDLLGAASLAGHAAWTVSLAAAHRGKDVAGRPALAETLGDLAIAAEAMKVRAERLAALWDHGVADGTGVDGSDPFLATLLGGRAIVGRLDERLAAFLEEAPPASGGDLERAVRDVEIGKIGGGAVRHQVRRFGERLAREMGGT